MFPINCLLPIIDSKVARKQLFVHLSSHLTVLVIQNSNLYNIVLHVLLHDDMHDKSLNHYNCVSKYKIALFFRKEFKLDCLK